MSRKEADRAQADLEAFGLGMLLGRAGFVGLLSLHLRSPESYDIIPASLNAY